MAGIATKTVSTAAILAGVLALLLLLGGVGVYVLQTSTADEQSVPLAALQPVQSPADRAAQDSGQPAQPGDSTVEQPANKPTDPTPSPPEPESDTVVVKIQGRIIDEQGNGIGGALVRTWRATAHDLLDERTTALNEQYERLGPAGAGQRTHSRPRGEDVAPLNMPAALAGVRADAQGNYVISDRVARSEALLTLELVSSSLGFNATEQTVQAAPSVDRTIVQDFTLPRLGRFITFRTQPAFNASIYVDEMLVGENGGGSSSNETQLLPDGTHQLEADADIEREGKAFYLKIVVPGFLPATVRVRDNGEARIDLGTIELDEGRSLTGIVVDTEGVPVEGAIVRTQAVGSDDFWSAFDPGPGDSFDVTGKDGTFRLTAVGTEVDRVSARHAALAEAFVAIDQSTDPKNLRLVMHPGVTVSGRVRFLAGGEPTGESDLKVVLMDKRTFELTDSFGAAVLAGAKPDEHFVFQFERVAPGDYVLRAFMNAGQRVSPPVAITVGSQPFSADIEYGSGPAIFGVVTGPDGPMAGAGIQCYVWKNDPEDYVGWETCGDCVSDDQGRYRTNDLRPGKYALTLVGIERGFSILDERIVEVSDQPVELNLLVSPTARSNKIVGKWIGSEKGSWCTARLYGVGHLDGYCGTGVLDAEGNFEIADIPPGQYYLCTEVARLYLFRQEITFDGWGETISVDRTFTMATIDVTVADESGVKPEALVWAYPVRDYPRGHEHQDLSAMSGQEARTYTSNGSARLTNLLEGSYIVYAKAEGYPVQTTVVDVTGAASAQIVLGKSSGTARFTCVPAIPEGEWASAAVVAEDAPGKPIVHFGYNHKEFGTLPLLSPGRYSLILKGESIVEQKQSFTVSEGSATEVEFQVRQGASIEVRATGEDLNHALVQMAALDIRDAWGNFAFGASRGSTTDGRTICVTSLAAGTYTLTLRLDGYRPCELKLEVAAGEAKVVDAVLKKQ
jgi:protocatechuate 3,4-dioxygenase beta subunit